MGTAVKLHQFILQHTLQCNIKYIHTRDGTLYIPLSQKFKNPTIDDNFSSHIVLTAQYRYIQRMIVSLAGIPPLAKFFYCYTYIYIYYISSKFFFF